MATPKTITRCVTTAVTLVPGQSFILPPGATLVASTNIDAIDTTCADLDNLEQLGCYIAAIGSHDYSGEAYSYQNRIWFRGYRLNGVDTIFESEIQVSQNEECLNMGPIGDILKAAGIGVIYTASSTSNTDGTDRACTNMLLIQTVPSVANNLEILVRMNAEDGATQDPKTNTFPRIPFLPSNDIANNLKPSCPNDAPSV